MLGAFMTVCEIRRNDAEARLEAVLLGGADPGAELPALKGKTATPDREDDTLEDVDQVDIEDVARDAIRIRLVETFQSHQLAELTAAILRARGLTCVVSPPGPDKGVDIVAGSGPLGLDSPRIVVQCKSSATPMDISVIQRLQGAMGTLGAEQALLVAYGGVNKSASELLTNQQFKVKVWDVDDILNMLLDCYDSIDPTVREMIPLKNVWTLTNPGE
jgi:restriction system protein